MLTGSSLYQPSQQFVCLDGSSTIAFERINDDYCDCDDASDEPGIQNESNVQCTN